MQGVISPIHLYVDTVLGSGTTGALAPRFGVSCAITSEYLVGQTIVFRVYANNADWGGAVMDSSNNTPAIIDMNMGIIDIIIEPARGIQKFINRITVTRTGGIAAGGFIQFV